MTAPDLPLPEGSPEALLDAAAALQKVRPQVGAHSIRFGREVDEKLRESWRGAGGERAVKGAVYIFAGTQAVMDHLSMFHWGITHYAEALAQAQQTVRRLQAEASSIEDAYRRMVFNLPGSMTHEAYAAAEKARLGYQNLLTQHQAAMATLAERTEWVLTSLSPYRQFQPRDVNEEPSYPKNTVADGQKFLYSDFA